MAGLGTILEERKPERELQTESEGPREQQRGEENRWAEWMKCENRLLLVQRAAKLFDGNEHDALELGEKRRRSKKRARGLIAQRMNERDARTGGLYRPS